MNIPFHKPFIGEEEINAVVETLRAGWITHGKKTEEFENKFKDYIGCKNAVAVNSCTAALHLALKVIDLKEGDEVLVPALTFVSTAEVVRYFNAKPVFVDVEPNTLLINPEKIEEKITGKTKVIIPVHYSGQACDMDKIMEIAKKHNLFVIEDAAHSLPSWYKGRKIGTIGDFTCFSFYATKTLTTGEGGMITTENDSWAEKLKILRLHGINKDAWKRYDKEGTWKYDVLDLGYKYNTTDINSALGIEQLKKLELMWEKRKEIANRYNSAFKDINELTLYKIKENRVSSYHLYPLILNLEKLKISRDKFIEEIKKNGIATSVHFIPLYEFSYYKNLGYKKQDFLNTKKIADRIVSLPIFPSMTEEEVNYVIKNTREILKNFKK